MKLVMKGFSGRKWNFLDWVSYFTAHWKSVVIVVVPLVLLPLALIEGKEGKCGYVICVMAFFWVTEVLPLAVTSLFPIVLFPVFGILSSEEVSMVYFKDTNVMFLGAIIMALAIEKCNIHKRIALKVLLSVGTSPRRLMLGLMGTSMFLSMWICNAAATAMMTPIALAVLEELKSHEKGEGEDGRRDSLTETRRTSCTAADALETRRESLRKVEKREANELSDEEMSYFLGIAYASNIGGTGTITGTATNLTFKGIFESIFPEGNGINFASWMEFNVPLMVLNTFLAWVWLQLIYMGPFRKRTRKEATAEQHERIRDLMRESYNQLGPFSYHEGSVLVLFIIDVLLWFFRKPEFVTGWGSLFPEKVVKDGSAAIAIVILLFILPSNRNFMRCCDGDQQESLSLLDWKTLQNKFPFGIILLLGGGFAVSKGSDVSGLSEYVGTQLEVVKDFPRVFILTIIVIVATFATEICSNTAVANIFLPMLARMCRAIGLHPLYLMLPATISCSYAFMLPVATPPNAIVMTATNMKISQMMKAGFGMNLICMASLILSFIFIGVPLYGFDTFPNWAGNGNMTFIVK